MVVALSNVTELIIPVVMKYYCSPAFHFLALNRIARLTSDVQHRWAEHLKNRPIFICCCGAWVATVFLLAAAYVCSRNDFAWSNGCMICHMRDSPSSVHVAELSWHAPFLGSLLVSIHRSRQKLVWLSRKPAGVEFKKTNPVSVSYWHINL